MRQLIVPSKEQLSLVLRFVDDNQNIREDFVRLLHCKWGLSGESPTKLVLDELINFNLSIDDCTPPPPSTTNPV